ncbi:hypothetical protein K3495_g331 [Podosphaera aphanis]|nr:hypothetical protein K3495_g331 [Podosphaera aphanis]
MPAEDQASDKISDKAPVKAAADGSGRVSVLKSQAYNDISVSDGVAGTTAERVNKLFADIDMNNLANVSDEDLQTIKNTHDVAENAELKAFDPAIDAATGDELAALKRGRIANKILKATATVLNLKIRMARGETFDPDDFALQEKKVTGNTAADVKAAGLPMKGVKFNGRT